MIQTLMVTKVNTDIFQGYKITIDPGTTDDKITVNYPEEFISYLNSKGTKLSDEVNFTSDNVNNELKKTESKIFITFHMINISYHGLNQFKNVAHDTYGYHQNLKITP